jgi:hypothetical protein
LQEIAHALNGVIKIHPAVDGERDPQTVMPTNISWPLFLEDLSSAKNPISVFL